MSTPARHLPAPERGDPSIGDPLLVRSRGRARADGAWPSTGAAEALQVAAPVSRPRAGGQSSRPGPSAPAGRGRQEAERPALKVVPRAVRRRRAGVVITSVVTSVFVLMLGLVAFQAKIAQNQMKLDRTDRQLQDAETHYSQLRLQVAQLEAPTRVIDEAKRLGLVRPAPEQVKYLTASSGAVGQVAGSMGSDETAGPTGNADAADWASLKPLLQAAPLS